MIAFHSELQRRIDRVKQENILFYIGAIILTVAIKLFYSHSSEEQLVFILKPVSMLVGMFFGEPFYFSHGLGYCSSDQGLIIGKSCSGVNFLVIAFCMFVFTFLHQLNRIKEKIAAFGMFMLSAYVITLLVNGFRIIGSITVLRSGVFAGILDAKTVHLITNIVFYFSFLVVCYFITDKMMMKVSVTHENTA